MTKKQSYRIFQDSLQEQFMALRCKFQIYGGGYGNGKTSAACVKTLQLLQQYPGCQALMARSTYPKLNDTLRKEFEKWTPQEWIKSFAKSKNSDNTCVLKNGSVVSFRYIDQTSRGQADSTSNLLSATYDLIVIDQIEDPEITEKDFNDLLGRLRGQTDFYGDDMSMPRTGPRWMIITLNPTSNWPYKRLIKPLHLYQKMGIVTDELLCLRDRETRSPILGPDGKPILMIDVVEGSTYDNKENLPDDFIETLESVYTGQMRERFLMGKWGSFEGLVYPDFSPERHGLARKEILEYLDEERREGFSVAVLEGYDYGIAVPSCYLIGSVDRYGNIFLVDGFYRKEFAIQGRGGQISEIKRLRSRYGIRDDNYVKADPSIFRRGPGAGKKLVGSSVADLFYDGGTGIRMEHGNAAIINGITKVNSYVGIQEFRQHPITGNFGAPRLFYAYEMDWFEDEISTYRWKKDSRHEDEDKPVDGNDHALDALKYMLSHQPNAPAIIRPQVVKAPSYMSWHEYNVPEAQRHATPWRH